MKKEKRIIIGLSTVLVASAIVFPTLTAISCNQLKEAFNGGLVLIEGSKGYTVAGLKRKDRANVTNITVPESINGIPVVEIMRGAFKGCTNLQSITLPFIGHTKDATGTSALFGYIFGDEMWEGCAGYTWQQYSTNDNYDVLPSDGVPFVIPAFLDTVTITGDTNIAPGAFSGCTYIKNVNFTSTSNALTATEIGNFAFYNCKSLKTFTLPSSINTIGRCAFAGCRKMKEFTINNSVETIKHNAFANCVSAYKFTIPETVVYMGKQVFTNFEGLIMCEAKTQPATWDPDWVSNTTTVVYDYHGSGVIYADTMIVTICGQDEKYATVTQLLGDYWKGEDITIPGTVESAGTIYKIEKLGPNLFLDNTNVKKLTISENIKVLSPNCFEGCTNLEEITIPDTLTTIGASCFKSCNSLKSVDFKHVTEIGDSAFEELTGLTSVDFGDSIQTIGDSAFKNCINLTPLREKDTTTKNPLFFPKSIKSIGDYAFYNICKLIPTDAEGATTKADRGDIIFEAGNVNEELTIGESAFELAGVRSTSAEYAKTIYFYVNFNNAPIKKFNKCAFKNCYTYGLFGFPQNVEEIGEQAFFECIPVYTIENDTTSLTCRLLQIPKSVKTIGYRAFYDCYNCGFRFEGAKDNTSQLTSIGEQSFRYCSYNPVNPGDDKSDGAYKEIYIPDSVTYCGPYAFGSNTGARTVHISTGLTRLEPGVFSSCKNLGYDQDDTHLSIGTDYVAYDNPIIIPENITWIGYSVFSDCNVLKAVTIKGQITALGSSAFANCVALEHGKTMTSHDNKPLNSLIFTDNLEHVTSFGSSIYQGCTNLVWAPWQTNVASGLTAPTSIPSYSFTDCNNLTNFEVLDKVTSIGNSAFRSCESMTQVTGMSAVKYIYQNAFDGCKGLTSISIPNGCHTIGDYAFKNCTNLGKNGYTFTLPTDIVKAWTSSSNVGMGAEPFVGWGADQTIQFTSANIDEEETAKQTGGKLVLKWGWILKPDNASSPSYYTCETSGSSVVHFVKI